jgi:hypothetical protein
MLMLVMLLWKAWWKREEDQVVRLAQTQSQTEGSLNRVLGPLHPPYSPLQTVHAASKLPVKGAQEEKRLEIGQTKKNPVHQISPLSTRPSVRFTLLHHSPRQRAKHRNQGRGPEVRHP